MTDYKSGKMDMNELTKLTPFGFDVYQKRTQFTSGNLFVETNVLESAKPLQPWSSQTSNSLELVMQSELNS